MIPATVDLHVEIEDPRRPTLAAERRCPWTASLMLYGKNLIEKTTATRQHHKIKEWSKTTAYHLQVRSKRVLPPYASVRN